MCTLFGSFLPCSTWWFLPIPPYFRPAYGKLCAFSTSPSIGLLTHTYKIISLKTQTKLESSLFYGTFSIKQQINNIYFWLVFWKLNRVPAESYELEVGAQAYHVACSCLAQFSGKYRPLWNPWPAVMQPVVSRRCCRHSTGNITGSCSGGWRCLCFVEEERKHCPGDQDLDT